MDAIYTDVLRRLELPAFHLAVNLLIGLATIIAAYWYSTRNHGYWKNLGVTFEKPLPLFGTLLSVFRKPMHDVDVDACRRHGRIFGTFEGNKPVIWVTDPELLRDILIKDFQFFPNRRKIATGIEVFDKNLSNLHGEDWKRVRTIITPTFTTGKIKRMFNVFKDCADTLGNNFRKSIEKGEPVNAKSMYGAFTMDVIASSAFSTKIDSHNDPSNEFVSNAKKVFTSSSKWAIVMFFLFPRFMKLFRIFGVKAMEFFEKVTLQMIEHRKNTGETRNDFLQLLLDTADEVSKGGNIDTTENGNDSLTANYGKDNNAHVFKGSFSKKGLSQIELVAQCAIFFVAGYETTASTLAFANYELALNPDIQEKLIKEVDEALKETGGELTYETIQGMKYLDNVISETLRLYPVIRLERAASEDYKLGDTGITIPKGMIVTVPVYAIHRDPNNFPDPERFDPDRFTPEERAKRSQFVYLPFGAGPRNCAATRFALLEIKVCLAHVLSRFRIKRSPETKVPLEFRLGQGLLQPTEVLVQIEERKDSPLRS